MNNVLAAIMGLTSALRSTCPDEDPRAKSLESILHASNRGRELVKALTDFARKGLEEPPPARSQQNPAQGGGTPAPCQEPGGSGGPRPGPVPANDPGGCPRIGQRHHQPWHQRPGCHARRRNPELQVPVPRGRQGRAGGCGHRARHDPRSPGPRHGTLLHHQARRERYWPWPGTGLRDGEGARGIGGDSQPAGPGDQREDGFSRGRIPARSLEPWAETPPRASAARWMSFWWMTMT